MTSPRSPLEEDLEDMIWRLHDEDTETYQEPLPSNLIAQDIDSEGAGSPALREMFLEDEISFSYLQQLCEQYDINFADTYPNIRSTEYNIPYALVKISGSCLTEQLAEDIANLSHVISLAVVVGGGDDITEECIRRGLDVEKYGPWRVTPKPVLDVVVDVMTSLTKNFAQTIIEYGGKAKALVGTPYQPLIFADKVDHFDIDGKHVEAGYFGVITKTNEDLYLTSNLVHEIQGAAADVVPVIAALGHEWSDTQPEQGYQPLNIDGDSALGLIAHKVGPEIFAFVTYGSIKASKSGRGYQLQQLSVSQFEVLRHNGQIDESLALKLSEGFIILGEYGGTRSVTLLTPNHLVPHVLDTQRVYGTTLLLSTPKTN